MKQISKFKYLLMCSIMLIVILLIGTTKVEANLSNSTYFLVTEKGSITQEV